MTPLDVAKTKNQGKCPAAYKVARDILEMFSKAQDSLPKAQQRMKKYVDQHHRSVEFNVDDPDRNMSKRAPPSIPTQFDAEIEKILDHRVVGTSKKNTKTEFLIHWKGKSVADAVWEKAKDLWQFDDQIDDYLKKVSMRTSVQVVQCSKGSRCLGVGMAAWTCKAYVWAEASTRQGSVLA
ncbi:hypothetical protein KY285_000922 [Solanum tuberosum]|nr:hypothetical protein KY285_000922 [Solanum tuberosum]